MPRTRWLSIVLPCLNEAELVAERIRLIRAGGDLGARAEIVVADATEEGGSLSALEGVHWISGLERGRGGQLAAGARAASGRVLLFHHADNELREDHLRSLRRALEDGEVEAGAFYRDFGANWPEFAGLESIARWWGREHGILYGDQSVFVRRELYDRLGGIRELPLMEDVEFSRRLRKVTRVLLLDPPLEASMRKFEKKGRWKNKLANLRTLLLHRLGVSEQKLYESYYRRD